ncbi:proteoglycan 3-like [Macrotis lagotis]|uniref:proteoglycan 3-like n=1 Tax=Macrotis lagotis TaxID=92651 RepID=UPI003D69A5AA
MKLAFVLSLVLLGTGSSLHLRNETINLETLEEVAGETEGSKVPERGEAFTSDVNSYEKEKEEVTELVLSAKDDILEPKKEDEAYVPGKTVRYLLVNQLKSFSEAQRFCQQFYKGNLVSVHNSAFNCKLHNLAKRINQNRVWIGAYTTNWGFFKKFRWIDGSAWDFSYWAICQPLFGWGRCVALSTNGSGWRRTSCHRPLPFICSY